MADHQRLIDELWNLEIRGALFNWLQAYLDGRRNAVRVAEGCSEFFVAPSWVPQGSSLEPILFMLFQNDLCLILRISESLFYADDSKIFKCVNSPLDCYKLQRDFTTFAD